jgi:hypothetical protein
MQVEEDSNQENMVGRLEQQHPPRGIALSEGNQWRAAHRRPFCAQYDNVMFTVRDIWVIGPVRQNKAVAILSGRVIHRLVGSAGPSFTLRMTLSVCASSQ